MVWRKWKWFVYIIETKDGYYYTGRTWNPEIRYEQHLSGFGGGYTAKHGVRKLVYLEEHEDFEMARIRETKIKDMSVKKKKVLIDAYKN